MARTQKEIDDEVARMLASKPGPAVDPRVRALLDTKRKPSGDERVLALLDASEKDDIRRMAQASVVRPSDRHIYKVPQGHHVSARRNRLDQLFKLRIVDNAVPRMTSDGSFRTYG